MSKTILAILILFSITGCATYTCKREYLGKVVMVGDCDRDDICQTLINDGSIRWTRGPEIGSRVYLDGCSLR